MSKPYSHHAGSNLPEVNHEQESYAYALPVQSPAYSLPSQQEKDYYGASVGQAPPSSQAPPTTRKSWMRWWVLALIGLFIALIAGLIGGFIGKAIQEGRQSSSDPHASTATAAAQVPSTSSCPNTTSITPPANAPANVVGTITIPDTGCGFPSNKARRRIERQTTFTKVNYTTICNSGWPGSDAIIGIWALSPSDCMEACDKYNAFVSKPTGKQCIGGGFIPAWTNQTASAKAQGGDAFNCYLKDNNKNIVVNDRAGENLEVVALCLDGQCNGIGG